MKPKTSKKPETLFRERVNAKPAAISIHVIYT